MKIKKQIEDSIGLKQQVLADHELLEELERCIGEMIHCYEKGHKVLLCGNGGSAADAQHLAAELSGRFYFDRPPLNAEALHVNTSFLTAVANDYSFEQIYERMVMALGKEGDMLLAFSTSGHSPNIVNALVAARKLGMITVGFTGQEGGKINEFCDILFKVPSADTPRIQEVHILLGHIICENVEEILFKL
ncbi:MAG: D-sedoheptulose 7-phosphate isomerase [Bacteroides sp.]|jgi:D-sedoheptulose 7-phosphate isomerase|nr:D-sedoheptulose 7-phosphate isomerase [Bacteroides sp.]